jgi:C4-dicarboxylate-specific signal transduction histidine kinase
VKIFAVDDCRPGPLLTRASIKNVVHSVFSVVESLATAKQLALRTEVPAHLPSAHGDERRLTQVLPNKFFEIPPDLSPVSILLGFAIFAT